MKDIGSDKDIEKATVKKAAEHFKLGQAQLKKAQVATGEQAIIEYEHCLREFKQAVALRPNHTQYLQMRGRCFMAMQQYQLALDDFGMCIRLDPDTARHYGHRGLCYQRLGRTEEALKDYNDALRREKDMSENSQRQAAEYHYERALVYIDLECFEEAIAGFDAAIKRLGSPFKAWFQRGICCRKVGRMAESIENLKQAINIDQTSADAHNHLGLSYVEEENFEEAKRCFAQAIENDPIARYFNNRGLASYHVASAGGEHKHFEEAIADFTNALQTESTAPIYFNRGNAKFQLGRYQEALEDYTAAILLEPENATYLHHKGLAFQGCGDVTEAINFYELALKEDEHHHPSRFHLGLMCHADSQYERALEAFNGGVPADAALHEARGLVHRDMADYRHALADFNAVIELEPDVGQHHYNRGVVYHRMGQEQDAVEDLTKAVNLGSTSAAVFSERGLAWRALGNMAQATIDLTAAIEADGSQTSYLSNRAQCLFEQGLFDRAEVDLTRALQLNGTDSELLYKRGITRYAQTRYAEAIADLKAALKEQPPRGHEAEIQYHLGVSYANLGKQHLAVPCYDEAVRLSPDRPHYLHERAKSLQAVDQHQQALHDFTRVIELQPTNARAIFRRAFSFKAQGLYDEAAEDFEAAKEFAPDDPRLVVNYRKVYSVPAVSLGPCGHEDPHASGHGTLGPREAKVRAH